MQTILSLQVEGFIKVFDPVSNEIFVEKSNAINYENFSEALAYSIANKQTMYMFEMELGNGGTTVDPTGIIQYLPTNTNSSNGELYNKTFFKIVDELDSDNADPSNNKMTINHVPGKLYTDVVVTCLLSYGEPGNQSAFDNSSTLEGDYVFDELGIKAFSESGEGLGKLLTHVVFHPVQKSLNRQIQIDYTIRIQSITNVAG